jgi:CDP-diacylglycerol--glycerol-3-phosphate 3-phosphatidyltransferase
MSLTTEQGPPRGMFNVPNQITAARLGLAILAFALMPWGLYLAAFVVFVVAASTDWVDGYWARKYGQVTKLGRVFDPFVDKILICGMFIFLAAIDGSGIAPWMAVVVVGREMLVTVLRSFIEQSGGDFSARMTGKLKMVFQCLAVCVSLLVLEFADEPALAWSQWALMATVWLAVLSTIQSGLVYVGAAAQYFRE